MKNTIQIISSFTLLAAGMLLAFAFKTADKAETTIYEYKQFSTIESIIPGGAGRSRILTTDNSGTLVEKDLLNFYSLAGINFGNITNNDRLIVDKINEFSTAGWELYQVSVGASSSLSTGSMMGNSSSGIYLTRYLFRKPR